MKRPKPKPWKKPRKHKRRPNPLKARGKRRSGPLGHLDADRRQMLPCDEATIMLDPIFLYHVSSAILRFLERSYPVTSPSRLQTYEEAAQEAMAEFDKEHRREEALQCVHCGKTAAEVYVDSYGDLCLKNTNTCRHEFTKEGPE